MSDFRKVVWGKIEFDGNNISLFIKINNFWNKSFSVE